MQDFRLAAIDSRPYLCYDCPINVANRKPIKGFLSGEVEGPALRDLGNQVW